jgi:hypothetical protein
MQIDKVHRWQSVYYSTDFLLLLIGYVVLSVYFCPKNDLIRLFLLSLIPFTFNCNLLGKKKNLEKVYFLRLRKKKKKLWRFNTFKKKRGYLDLRGGNFNCIFLTWNAKMFFAFSALFCCCSFFLLKTVEMVRNWVENVKCAFQQIFLKLYFEVERFCFF